MQELIRENEEWLKAANTYSRKEAIMVNTQLGAKPVLISDMDGESPVDGAVRVHLVHSLKRKL